MLAGSPQIEQNEKVFNEIKNKIIDMVNEKRTFDSAYFNNLTLDNLRLVRNGKSLIWWLSWAVSKGRTEAFDLTWLKYNQSYTYQDFQVQGELVGPSAQCLLAQGAKFNARPMNAVLQRWSQQLTASELRSKSEDSPSMFNALVRAAKENKINRQFINSILANVAFIGNNEDMLSKSPSEPSIHELIEQGIAQNCDWSVKIKRFIEARNAFFEKLMWLTSSSKPSVNDFAILESLAHAAQKEGYSRAPNDADVLIAIISAARTNEWTAVFELLKNNATNECIMTQSLYNALLKTAKKNVLIINQVNQCFSINKQYNHEDFTCQYNSLLGFKDRFKQLSGNCVSHALIKKGSDDAPLTAVQFTFPKEPFGGAPNIAKLNSINGHIGFNGSPMYEAVTMDNQKMVSTDTFSIEVQTKVDAVFVCEKYDLIFFTLKPAQGTFEHETVEIFKPEAKVLYETDLYSQCELDEKDPVIRGGERNISLTDLYMRQEYPDKAKLHEREHARTEEVLQGKTSDLYKKFYDFYNSFFSQKMLQITQRIFEGKWLFAPEALHAIAKMFFRPSEQQHFDIKNLAIAPKWVNSLMMVIESALRWHAVHAPFAKLKIKTLFNTFPMHHILKEGTIEATLSTEKTQVKISKALLPYQKNPPFPQITDITQTTFVLNCLLNQQAGKHISLAGFSAEPQKTLTIAYENPAPETAEPKVVPAAATVLPKPHK